MVIDLVISLFENNQWKVWKLEDPTAIQANCKSIRAYKIVRKCLDNVFTRTFKDVLTYGSTKCKQGAANVS